MEFPSPTGKEPEREDGFGGGVVRLRGTPKGSQHRAPTMLLCLTLLLLTGLSACSVAGDKEQALGTEAGAWVTVNLEVTSGRGRG